MNYTEIIITVITGIVAPCMILVVKFALEYIAAKTKDINIRKALAELESIAIDVVESLKQTVVDGLKAGQDGKLTADQAAEVLDTAYENILDLASDSLIKFIEDKGEFAEDYVKTKIEGYIGRMK